MCRLLIIIFFFVGSVSHAQQGQVTVITDYLQADTVSFNKFFVYAGTAEKKYEDMRVCLRLKGEPDSLLNKLSALHKIAAVHKANEYRWQHLNTPFWLYMYYDAVMEMEHREDGNLLRFYVVYHNTGNFEPKNLLRSTSVWHNMITSYQPLVDSLK